MLSHYRPSRPRPRNAVVIGRYDLPLRRAMLARQLAPPAYVGPFGRVYHGLGRAMRPQPQTRAGATRILALGTDDATTEVAGVASLRRLRRSAPSPRSGDARAPHILNACSQKRACSRIQRCPRCEHIVTQENSSRNRSCSRETPSDVSRALLPPERPLITRGRPLEGLHEGHVQHARHFRGDCLAVIEPSLSDRCTRRRYERHRLAPSRPAEHHLLGKQTAENRAQPLLGGILVEHDRASQRCFKLTER